MPITLLRIPQRDLHPNADQEIVKRRDEYTDVLLVQSELIAAIEGSDEVQKVHVDRAADIVATTRVKDTGRRELAFLFGSALIGAFLQGFITELSNERPKIMAAYTGMGIIGIVILWLTRRK